MARNVPVILQSVVAEEQNEPVEIYEVYLDDQTYYYANAEQDITLGAQVYTALSIKRTRISTSMSSKVDEISIQLDNINKGFTQLISTSEMQGRRLVVKKVLREYLSSTSNIIILFDGRMDAITIDQEKILIRVVSWLDAIIKKYPGRMYQPQCNYRFGDISCKIDKTSSENTFSGTADSSSTASILKDVALIQADNYWKGGFVQITAGTNSGSTRPITSSSIAITEPTPETSWEQVPDYGSTADITSIVEHDNKIYLGLNDGTVRVSSSGITGTFTEAFDTSQDEVKALISWEGDLYAATYKSGDYGKIYKYDGAVATLVYTHTAVEAALCFVNFGSSLYCGFGDYTDVNSGSIRRSVDGDDWSLEVLTGVTSAEKQISCLAIHTYSGTSYIFAGSWDDGKIFRSTTGDIASWSVVWDSPHERINSIVSHSLLDDDYIYASTGTSDGKVFRSTDGSSWTEVFDVTEANATTLITYNSQLFLGVGSSDSKIYETRSGELAIYWGEVLDAGVDSIVGMGTFDSGNGTWLYAGTNDGGADGKLYRRFIAGGDFSNIEEFAEGSQVNIRACIRFGDYLYIGGDDGKIHRSLTGDTGSVNWEVAYDTGEDRVMALYVYNSYLYVGTWTSGGSGKAFRSSNGTTWNNVFTDGSGATGVYSFIEFSSNFYLGTGHENAFQNKGFVYRSASGDIGSWNLVLDTGDQQVFRLNIHNNKIYATEWGGSDIYRSSSGDLASWSTVLSVGSSYYAIESFNNYIYCINISGINSYIYRSVSGDSGSWSIVFSKTTSGSLYYLKTHGDYLYLCGAESVNNFARMWRTSSGNIGEWPEIFSSGITDGRRPRFIYGDSTTNQLYLWGTYASSLTLGWRRNLLYDPVTLGQLTLRYPFSVACDNTSQYVIYRGCNKTQEDCLKYDNWRRFGGFTTIPKKPIV